MKKISYILPIIIFLLTGKSTFSQTQTVDDAVFENLYKTFTLNKDGSQEFNYYKKIRYNTYHAFFNLYGETFITYNTKYQELKINKAITTMADGTIVEVPKNAFNEMLPSFAAKAPAYNYLKELVITHTALEIGAVVELDYTIITKPGFFPAFDNAIFFREEIPVNDYKVTIKLPEEITLKSAITATIGTVKPSNEDGMNIYTWNVKNLSGAPKDVAMPPVDMTALMLVFSTANSYQELFTKIMNQPSFEQQTLPKSAQVVLDKLLQENRMELMQVLNIQNYIVNNINTVNIPDLLLGYHFATPSETWQRNYGTPAEKAILMALMLKKAGFAAYPSAVCNDKSFAMNIPSTSIYNQWVVKIMLSDGKPLYLSPTKLTDINMKYKYLENSVAYPLDPTIDQLRPDMFSSILPINQISGNMVLDTANNLTGNIDVKIEAPMNPYLEIEKNIQQLKKLLTVISEKSIKDPKKPNVSEQKTEALLNFTQPNACDIKGNYYFLTIPELKSSVTATNLGPLPMQRNSYLQLQTQRTITNIKLNIPEDFVLVTPPLLKESRKSFGYYKIEITTEGNTVEINRQVEISEPLLIPIHYAAFRSFLLEWNDDSYKELILKKK